MEVWYGCVRIDGSRKHRRPWATSASHCPGFASPELPSCGRAEGPLELSEPSHQSRGLVHATFEAFVFEGKPTHLHAYSTYTAHDYENIVGLPVCWSSIGWHAIFRQTSMGALLPVQCTNCDHSCGCPLTTSCDSDNVRRWGDRRALSHNFNAPGEHSVLS